MSPHLIDPASPPGAGCPIPALGAKTPTISLVQLIFIPAMNASFFVSSPPAPGCRFLMDAFLRRCVLILFSQVPRTTLFRQEDFLAYKREGAVVSLHEHSWDLRAD